MQLLLENLCYSEPRELSVTHLPLVSSLTRKKIVINSGQFKPCWNLYRVCLFFYVQLSGNLTVSHHYGVTISESMHAARKAKGHG